MKTEDDKAMDLMAEIRGRLMVIFLTGVGEYMDKKGNFRPERVAGNPAAVKAIHWHPDGSIAGIEMHDGLEALRLLDALSGGELFGYVEKDEAE